MAALRRCFQQPYSGDSEIMGKYRTEHGLADDVEVEFTTAAFRQWWKNNRGRW